jgi:hypothetical protein
MENFNYLCNILETVLSNNNIPFTKRKMRKNDMRYTITNKLVTNTKTNNSLGKLKITLEFHETPYQFNINHDAAIFFFHGGDKPILLENILGEVHLDFMCQPDKNGFYDSQTRELMKNCVTNLEEKIKQYKTK